MLRFEVGADDLLRSRFAISPLFELDNLLRKLSGMSPYRLPGAWSARLMPVYRKLRATTDLDAVLALHSRTRGPGFAAPPGPEHRGRPGDGPRDGAGGRATRDRPVPEPAARL